MSASVSSVMGSAAGAGRRHLAAVAYWPEALLFLVAFGVRMIPEMINGSLVGNFGYDPSVYYAAADALIHGRMPYRDFVLLHPPGVVLVDAPFAWLGSHTTDQTGFAALTVFFALLSAVSAVLVTQVARRLGLPRLACLLAGAVYALYFGALMAEYEARLEPLGCFILLLALLAFLTSRAKAAQGSGRSALAFAVLAGLALGAGMSVKIWWTLPALVLLGWEAVITRAYRRVAVMLAGLVIAVLVVDGPFLLIAKSKMWTMVVLDQTGRPPNNVHVLKPLAYLAIGWPSVHRGTTGLAVAVLVGGLVLLVALVRSWRVPPARVIAVMLVAQIGLIVVEPTWFQFYADYVTVALSLVVGAAAVRVPARAPMRDASPWFAGAVAAALAVSLAWTVPDNVLVTPVPSARLTAAVRGYRCVMSDSPMGLIDMDVLTRDLRDGCPNLIDVTGLIFVLYHQDRRVHEHGLYGTWNKDMIAYLRSGEAMLFFRTPRSIDLIPASDRLIERNGALLSSGGFTLYRVSHPVQWVPSASIAAIVRSQQRPSRSVKVASIRR